MKGRPPGTPKSEDPNKRKRKRQARERDLCDVKIKITEYFAGANRQMGEEMSGNVLEAPINNSLLPPDQSGPSIHQQGPARAFGLTGPNDGSPVVDLPGRDGRKYYTIQRVNGNGGNGKFDGTAGPH